MSTANVTIIVAPRERYSESVRSLLSIYSDQSTPFHLIYVDGGSPAPIRDAIKALQSRYGFKLIRTEHVLTPNEARNLAIGDIKTPWAMFVDNDIDIEVGWLGRLVAAGEANNAQLVGPLYMQRGRQRATVHMAGGTANFYEHQGKRRLRTAHNHFGMSVEEARRHVSSGPVELLEFHGMLVAKELLNQLGPFDENLLSTMEHVDLCLMTRNVGASVWLETESVLTYVIPRRLDKTDLGYFLTRWRHEWNVASLEHFAAKWQIDPEDPAIAHEIRWADGHRELAARQLAWSLGRIASRLKYHESPSLGESMLAWLEDRYIKPVLEQRECARLR